jgi:hypothetical protein
MELADRAVGGDQDLERTVAGAVVDDQPPRAGGQRGRRDRDAAAQGDPRFGARRSPAARRTAAHRAARHA